jgi:phage baseplate assembly protein W
MSAGAIVLSDIQSADWSLMLDANSAASSAQNATVAGSGLGNVVQGIADINQCLGIILSTPQGSDPLRPTFACDLWKWIDAPITIARPAIVREIVQAVLKWEPRVRLLRVLVNLVAGTLQNLEIQMLWQLKVDVPGAGNQTVTITVPRNLA